MTFSVDDFLGEFEAPTVEVRVCPRADLLEQHRLLERQLAEASSKGGDSLASGPPRALADEVLALEDEIEQATRTFKFRALSRRRWRALLGAHPPLKQHKADGLDFNPETFPVAAIAACAVEPSMTAEQAEQVADALPLGEFDRMWAAVAAVNLGASDTPKSVLATTIRRMNGAYSTTAPPAGSPGASS